MPINVTAVSCDASFAAMSAAFCARAKCCVSAARVAPAAHPHSDRAMLPAHANARKYLPSSTSGAASSMAIPTLFARSAKRRHCLASASSCRPLARVKTSPPSIPHMSRAMNCAAALAAVAFAAPTPTPSRSARVVRDPRTYEQRPCAVSQHWNGR